MTYIRILFGVGILLLILALVLSVRACTDQVGKAQLQGRQTGAAVESGHDAVQTSGNVAANAAARTNDVERAKDEIDKAPAGRSNDAAVRAACQLRSQRDKPRCVALLGPTPR